MKNMKLLIIFMFIAIFISVFYFVFFNGENINIKSLKIEYLGVSYTIDDETEIEIIENILKNLKYENELCDGINTHKLTINGKDEYYIKESCNEIQKVNTNKQASISNEDIEKINKIILNKVSNNQDKVEYDNVSTLDVTGISKEELIKFGDILYGKSYAMIDYAGGDSKIGIIDKLIDKDLVPKFNGQTNNEDILNAEVYGKIGENSLILKYNNNYVLFQKVK